MVFLCIQDEGYFKRTGAEAVLTFKLEHYACRQQRATEPALRQCIALKDIGTCTDRGKGASGFTVSVFVQRSMDNVQKEPSVFIMAPLKVSKTDIL